MQEVETVQEEPAVKENEEETEKKVRCSEGSGVKPVEFPAIQFPLTVLLSIQGWEWVPASKLLTLYTLTSVCKFSVLFSMHFLRC